MLRILGPGGRLCDGYSRREILRIGGLGLLGSGLSLSALTKASANSTHVREVVHRPVPDGRAPQHSTWDPKPDAPAEVRGDFKPIATNVPGLSLSELLPHTAKVADKICVLRAVSTGDNAHSSSGYYMLTGRPHQPMNVENANPGAERFPQPAPDRPGRVGPRGVAARGHPAASHLQHRRQRVAGAGRGAPGRSRDPWLLNASQTPEGFRIREIDLPAELDLQRLGRRRDLLDGLNRSLDALDRGPNARVLDDRTREAYDLLGSSRARRAFSLDDEPKAVRERYGETPFGQGVLLSRRLVEAGVRLVQVNWYRGADEPPRTPAGTATLPNRPG